MDNKNILFIIVFIVCVISLILGILTPLQNKYKEVNAEKNQSGFNKIISVNTNKIAVIQLSGVINSTSEANFLTEENSSMKALSLLSEVEQDNNVKGVILEINSPGGTVAMSQRLYNAVMKLRQKKPVIAVMDDVAASGGYYVASACDRIFAYPGTMTGSIGVIMSAMDFHKLLCEKLAINQNVIKSGKFKDIGSSSRAMTNEERQLLQDIVMDSYAQFKTAIIDGRVKRCDKYDLPKVELNENILNHYADGRVFTGRQALKLGFVDSTDGMDGAKDMVKKIAKTNGISDVNFVEYSKNSLFFDIFSVNKQQNSMMNFIPESMKYGRKPLYLWE